MLDTETNGLGGEACELTEVGAVLVGGGELHDRWSSLVRPSAPLRRGIQRFTGITQEMIDGAPEPEAVLALLETRLRGRVMVAHNAPFDRRVLARAFARGGLDWPDPPVLCTVALARAFLPLQRERRLAAVADALGIEVVGAHRALADAETCARVLCALLRRLCANATTVADAIALLAPRRSRRPARRLPPSLAGPAVPQRPHAGRPQLVARPAPAERPQVDFQALPQDPGVYLFRDAGGRTLYVGKSISIRSRARAHYAPSAPEAPWTAHATIVDYRSTCSELGALVLENRLIKQLRPPGNTALARRDDRLVYIRCRLDIAYPILDVASEPACGHAVTIGPLRGRKLALELVEQLDSLFGLRHCGRRLERREHPSAYGQMGRCLSPCLGDLDPNLYRRRLDGALALFVGGRDGGQRLLEHVEAQMRAAAAARRYERASWLRRRVHRLRIVLERVGGVLEATHARSRLVLAAHPTKRRFDAFWMLGGRLVDWGPVNPGTSPNLKAPLARGAPQGAPPDSQAPPDSEAPPDPGARGDLHRRTTVALLRAGRHRDLGAHVPRDEVDEVRIVAGWLAAHPQAPSLSLEPAPDRSELERFVAACLGDPQLSGTAARAPRR